MSLQISVTPGEGKPIHRQIASQIAAALALHRLRPGDRLAPCPQLAETLGVSPRAVKKAYQSLIRDGLVQGDAEAGLRVAPRTAGVGQLESAGATGPAGTVTWADLQSAEEVQRCLLPPASTTGDGFRLVARGAAARCVAGDFYDLFEHPDGSLGIVVADVAGSGVGASLIMASVKEVIPLLAAGREVDATLRTLNRRLHTELGRRRFVALTCARFEPWSGRLWLATAGLPEPYLLRPGEAPVELALPSPRFPLGLRREVEYQAADVQLAPGDRVLLYTDGLPEARKADGGPLGYEAFSALVAAAHGASRGAAAVTPAEEWLEGFLERVERALGGRAVGSGEPGPRCDDDWTLLLFERST